MICQLWDNSEALKLNIPCDENHTFYTWKGLVYFSAERQGNIFSCHIATSRKGKHYLRQAVNQFCQYMFISHWWCKYIAANINKSNKSVINLVKKCGFVKMWDIENREVYALCRS